SGNSGGSVSALGFSGKTSIKNSTIVFNTKTGSDNLTAVYSYYAPANTALEIQSTIITANADTHGQERNVGIRGATVVIGQNNLIGLSTVALPLDTIGGDPLLLPLHNNGGWTRTHALRIGSPAVNLGAAGSDTTDQRGSGYPRVIGNAADIGAYEGVDAQTIFYGEFD
ncbi:MAG TPA: choice-of-anchor Q domain-containing protein, partial [Rudaea sp.]